jgi:hypothetical protein
MAKKTMETWRQLEELAAKLPNLVVTGDRVLGAINAQGKVVDIDPLVVAACVAQVRHSLLELSESLQKKGKGKKNAGGPKPKT